MKLEGRLDQMAAVQPIYVYKNKEGLEKYDGIIKWVKDPEGKVERQSFKQHYPCGSFVVISTKGE
jgi:hypothetical protein